VAVLVGGGFGVGLAALIRGVVDLRAFTGGTVQPEMAVQPWGMVAVIGGFLLVIAIAIGGSATLARQASAAVLMRTEE
jgi:putative ABC transport system permease protein